MGMNITDKESDFVQQSGLYVLKHKDLDTAMVQMNMSTGRVEYVLDVYLPEELPVGVSESGKSIAGWWESRAVPDTRRGIQQALEFLRERTNLSLMLSGYGLSLTDHYWMQPVVNGEMKKKWIIKDGIRYLLKVNVNDYGK